MWDPGQYGRYAEERSRPFYDLVARIGAESPRLVVDLGCGPGPLTASLARRWPQATVVGLDSSPEMIAEAKAHAGGRLSFELGDIAGWKPPQGTDVIVSNAALQWVPGHPELVDGWIAGLGTGGWLGFQVPGNFDSPSHTILADLKESPRWSSLLKGGLGRRPVLDPEQYVARYAAPDRSVDAWETTYVHVLQGKDPVLEWLKGSALRPYLAQLEGADREEFLGEFGRRLREAYPAAGFGVALPFRRVFVVVRKL